MLIRSNPLSVYTPMFSYDRRGILIVTRRFIFATRTFARCWSV